LAKDPADRFATADEMRDALAQPALEPTVAMRTQTMPVPPVPPVVPPAAPPEPRPQPTTRTTTTATRRSRRIWPWVLVAALLLGLVAGAVVGLTGGNGKLPDTSAQEPVVTTTPPTLPATLVPQVPQNLAQLTALLAADPTKYGSAGPDLLKQLQDYQAKPDAKKASDLVNKVNGWVDDGKLDPAFGATVLSLLEGSTSVAATTPATAAPTPAAGPGHGPAPKAPKTPKAKGTKR
jgi:hypothetical protein